MSPNEELFLDHKEMVLLMVEAVTETKRPREVSTEDAYLGLFQHDVDQVVIEKIETGVARIERYIHDQALKAGLDVS